MKYFRCFLDFYIRSQIHVSIAVTAFSAITALEFQLHLSPWFYVFVFVSAMVGYNFVLHPAGILHLLDSKRSSFLVVLGGSLIVWVSLYLFKLQYLSVVTFSLLMLITFLYAIPVIRNKNLRNVSGIKVFVVALVWAGVTVVLPLEIEENLLYKSDYLLTFIQRFLIVVLLMIPFEIRDYSKDAPALITLPQQLGIRSTKRMGWGVIGIIIFLEALKDEISEHHLYSLLFFLFLLGIAIIKSSENRSRYFASFAVEGLPAIWWLLYVIMIWVD